VKRGEFYGCQRSKQNEVTGAEHGKLNIVDVNKSLSEKRGRLWATI